MDLDAPPPPPTAQTPSEARSTSGASSLMTSLKRARHLGPSGHGVHPWLSQRQSALALVPLSLWFIVSFSFFGGLTPAYIVYLGAPWNALLLGLFFALLYYHGYLGLRVIIEDYVSTLFWKFFWLTFFGWLALGGGLLTWFVLGALVYRRLLL